MISGKLDSRCTFLWPASKSMEEPTSGTFRAANIMPKFPHPRSCIGTFNDVLPGFAYCLRLKPSVIGGQVASGAAAAGITGLDLLIESGLLDSVQIVERLAYSKATNGGTRAILVGKLGGASLEDLRRQGGTIVSEYPEATRRYLHELGITADVRFIVGSVESLVASGQYDFCVVLVETGTSLKVNGLVELATVFESETVLIANSTLYGEPDVKEAVDFLARLLLGAIEARDKRYLVMNVPREKLEAIVGMLPSLDSPTVQTLANGDYAVSSVVPLVGLAHLKLRLLKGGASGIVELDAHSII